MVPALPVLYVAASLSTAAAVTASAAGGPDYVGIAALVSAVTLGFGSVVATIITLLRFRTGTANPGLEDAIDSAVAKALRERGQP